ncbi:MAG: NAD(P)-dependent oxidoreductase [Acidimicrobiales bacterium]
MRAFLTHNPEDLEAYYGRALPELVKLVEPVFNPLGRDLTSPELVEAATGCEFIVAHRATGADELVFDALPELLSVFRCAIDISNIDVASASQAGVLIANADKSFIASTAEIALGLMLSSARSIGQSTADYQNGVQPAQRPGQQLRGATVGIIGYGSIGSYLADLLHGIGMRVLIVDPFVTVPPDRGRQVDLGTLLAQADYVLPLAQAEDATVNLIGRPELAQMKHTATLVNVARGELIDEEAVATALDDGTLGGLAMDVGWAADQRPSMSLAARSGVVATPHLGGLTPQNADAQAISSVDQIAAVLRGDMPPRAVNPADAHRLQRFWTGK